MISVHGVTDNVLSRESNYIPDVSSIDIEVIRTVFDFIIFYEKNYKHLKHKQKHLK